MSGILDISSRLMLKFGKSEFGFLPRTFVLPADTKLLKKVNNQQSGERSVLVFSIINLESLILISNLGHL